MPRAISSAALSLCVVVCLALPAPATAQDSFTRPPADLLSPPLSTLDPGVLPIEPGAAALPVPYAPSTSGTDLAQPLGRDVVLEARLVAGQEPLREGVTWRLFAAEPEEGGKLPLVATAQGGTTTVALPPGTYFVHAAFGHAGATKRITVRDESLFESLILDAGGLKLDAVVGEDFPVPPDRITFEISQEDDTGQRAIVQPNAAPGLVLRLSAGTYHVVSRYGSVNSVVRADIQVEPGKLTEAVIRHDGAEVTLKLVSEAGGEALANTSWTVTTEAGDTLHESVGAFPRIVLAAGKYTAVANHKSQVFAVDFEVVSGSDRDVEVKLTDLVRQEPEFGLR